MPNSKQKITLSHSRDIPFSRLVLSQANVRRIKAGVSIEELAEDIARRTLLQSITVRPVLDDNGAETGMFEVPAGGRRYRALELLVKQKRLARATPIPCIVRTEGFAEEDSLAENVQRAPLHPLDQFRAFLALREKGMSEEEIAAAFFVSVQVVKQRLKLASVSPKLLDVYAEDGMTLDQLMAFTVTPDHERQKQVWESLQPSYTKEPYYIRRLLTEGAVRASDKRAQFVGIEAYQASGGASMRDLFQQDDGGWLQDPVLLDRLVAEKLEREVDAVRAEGWKWVEVATDFPYGHTYGLRHISGEPIAMSDEEAATAEALRVEYDKLEQAHSDADEPEEVDQRLGEIETALVALDHRPVKYDPEEIARAGVFVSIDGSGALRAERGYVRPEDEPAIPKSELETCATDAGAIDAAAAEGAEPEVSNPADQVVPEEDEGFRPISDRLLTELTAYRTLTLRDALAQNPDVAFLAALHTLCLKLFYRYTSDSCLDIDMKSVVFGSQAPGLNDTAIAKAVDERHRRWSEQLPQEVGDLWEALVAFDTDSRHALFAHCVALSINAVHESWNRRPRALAHADRIAEAIDLDIAAVGWSPTVDNYLGRVTKARILQAVREARGEQAARLIDHLKKGEMAEKAQDLLGGSGWLPEPLRTPGRAITTASPMLELPSESPVQFGDEESTSIGGETAVVDPRSRLKMRPPRQTRTQSRPSSTTELRVTQGPAGNGGPSPSRSALMSTQASDLARRLAEHAETVCRQYLSKGRRAGRYWIVGDVRNTPGRSMFVRLNGPASGKGAAGKWTDAATGEHGDLLDVIRVSCGFVDFHDVIGEARRFLSLPPPHPSPDCHTRQQPPAPTGSPESARRLFAISRPIADTIAETYLRNRGIMALHKIRALRFHARCYYRPDVDAPTEIWPALIAAVTDLAGNITGAHRTWLDPSGIDKAPLDTPRRAMGHLLGHGVRFGIATNVMAAGEGLETMLSLRSALPALPMLAALSANHLAAILFPATLHRLYIARDRDPAGDLAVATLTERAQAAGIEALTLTPALGDFNEDLRELGIEELGAALRVQLALEDVPRFLNSSLAAQPTR